MQYYFDKLLVVLSGSSRFEAQETEMDIQLSG